MIICGVFAFLLYANTLTHDFVLDDETVIGKNEITKAGIAALPDIFSTAYRAGFWDRNEGLYRPLSIALFAMEWQVAGNNPHFFHAVNVVLYAITAMLLFLTLSLFFENKNPLLPFAATLIFVAHPLHTEVVANIKSADEILSLLFSLVALYAIIQYAKRYNIQNLVVAGLAVFLAMLSKETAVTMVAVAPLSLYFFSKANTRQIITGTVPFVVAFAVYLAIRVSVLHGITGLNEVTLINNSLAGAGDNLATRLATAFSIIGRYLFLLFIPHPLSYDYSYNTIPLVSFAAPQALLSIIIIIALAVFAIRGLKRKDPVAWGILFFGTTLSLTSNLVFLIEATMAERFLFIPSLGFSVAIVFLLARLFKIDTAAANYKNISTLLSSNKGITAVVLLAVLLFTGKTIARNADWKDNLTLVKKDVQTYPNSARIRNAYGSIMIIEKGLTELNPVAKNTDLVEGVRQLSEAVKILPDYGEAWFNLGLGYKELKDYKSAISCFENAGKYMKNKEISFYVASGVAYGENGQYQQAFEMLNKAKEIDSTSSDPYNNMGLFYSRMKRFDESIAMLNKAMRLSPKDEFPPYNMGNTYAAMGDFKTAITYYQQACSINPKYDLSWVNMGNSYGAMKDYANALTAFKKALEINPLNENARHNIGTTYLLMGDTENAKKYLPQNRQ